MEELDFVSKSQYLQYCIAKRGIMDFSGLVRMFERHVFMVVLWQPGKVTTVHISEEMANDIHYLTAYLRHKFGCTLSEEVIAEKLRALQQEI